MKSKKTIFKGKKVPPTDDTKVNSKSLTWENSQPRSQYAVILLLYNDQSINTFLLHFLT